MKNKLNLAVKITDVDISLDDWTEAKDEDIKQDVKPKVFAVCGSDVQEPGPAVC